MEINEDIEFPVKDLQGRRKLTGVAREKGKKWADNDWFDGILQEPDRVRINAQYEFSTLVNEYEDYRETFTDDIDEAEFLYVSAFSSGYQEKWNQQSESNAFWRETYHIHVVKRDVSNGIVKFKFHLYDYIHLKKNCHIVISFNQEGEIITVEEVDE